MMEVIIVEKMEVICSLAQGIQERVVALSLTPLPRLSSCRRSAPT